MEMALIAEDIRSESVDDGPSRDIVTGATRLVGEHQPQRELLSMKEKESQLLRRSAPVPIP